MLGHEVTVITSDFPHYGSYEIETIPILRLPVLTSIYGAPICPTIAVRLAKLRADVIHLHIPNRIFADYVPIARKLKMMKDITLTLSFHLYLEEAPSYMKLLSNLYYASISRMILRSVESIVVPTQSYRARLIERFDLDPERIQVIPYGIDVEFLNPQRFDDNRIRFAYNLEGKKIILFAGRMDAEGAQQKGIKYLFHAIQMLLKERDDLMILIAGSGERLEYFRQYSKVLGIDRSIWFLGGVSPTDMPKFYSICDIFVLPSLFESFGISLAEAMAMEKPVVATRICGVMDVVEDGKTGLLVQPGNQCALTEAIKTILSDDRLAKRLGREGRKAINSRYSWDVVLPQILRLYQDSIDRKKIETTNMPL